MLISCSRSSDGSVVAVLVTFKPDSTLNVEMSDVPNTTPGSWHIERI